MKSNSQNTRIKFKNTYNEVIQYIRDRYILFLLTAIFMFLAALSITLQDDSIASISFLDSKGLGGYGFSANISAEDQEASLVNKEDNTYLSMNSSTINELALSFTTEIEQTANQVFMIEVEYYDDGSQNQFALQYYNSKGELVQTETVFTGQGSGHDSYNFVLDELDLGENESEWDIKVILDNDIPASSFLLGSVDVTSANTADLTAATAVVSGNSTTTNGMRVVYGDENFESTGVKTSKNEPWIINPFEGVYSLNCDVSPAFVSQDHSKVLVEIEYFDTGIGYFTILYNSNEPVVDVSSEQPGNIFTTDEFLQMQVSVGNDPKKQSETVELTNSGEWKTKTITLENTSFSNGLNDNDFAFVNYSPAQPEVNATPLVIRDISVIGLEDSEKSDNRQDIYYEIVNLQDNSIVLSGEQSVTSYPQTFSVGTDIHKNGLYTINIKSLDQGNTMESTPFSVMPTYDINQSANDIFGVCTHYGHAWFDGDVAQKAEAASMMGAGWIRDEMNWDRAETQKGVVEILPEWDEFVDQAIASGLKPILILAYGNPFYDNGGPPYTEEGLAAYANYVNTIVSHFEGRVEHFEIWNEFNLTGTVFNSTSRGPEDYVKILETAYTSIKTTNPNATVIGGAMSGVDVPWLTSILSLGAANYMDALSYHPYTQPLNPEDGGFLYAAINLPSLLAQYGASLPLWVTEVGWSNSTGHPGVSEIEAANNLVRSYVLGIVGGVDKIFWYDLINDGTVASEMEHNFGLLSGWDDSEMPLSAKPSYLAYNTVSGQLSDVTYSSFTGLSANMFVATFDKPNSNTSIMVAWTLNGEENLSLNILGSGAEVTDIYSNSEFVSEQGGKVQITLSPSPVFIECTPGANPFWP